MSQLLRSIALPRWALCPHPRHAPSCKPQASSSPAYQGGPQAQRRPVLRWLPQRTALPRWALHAFYKRAAVCKLQARSHSGNTCAG